MVASQKMTLLDKGRPRQYINVLTEAYWVELSSGLAPLFPSVDKVFLSLAADLPSRHASPACLAPKKTILTLPYSDSSIF